MPPGPIPVPFIGNSLPSSKPWIRFQEWSKKYGLIFTTWVGRSPTLVISDPEVAVDLMEKKSNKYSPRPRFVVIWDVYGTGTVLMQPYGKYWTIIQKILHRTLTPTALKTYKSRQEAEVHRVSFQIFLNPEEHERLFDRFTNSVLMASLSVLGAYKAESLPVLKYLPNFLAPWKRDIQEHAKVKADANMELVGGVKEEIRIGKEKGFKIAHSLTQTLLTVKNEEAFPLYDKDVSFISTSLFGAGSDTTAFTMCFAVLALVTHQSVLEAAHAEIDEDVGFDRSPTFSDEELLPYVRALVEEVIRWRPVTVLGGTPHGSSKDDVY